MTDTVEFLEFLGSAALKEKRMHELRLEIDAVETIAEGLKPFVSMKKYGKIENKIEKIKNEFDIKDRGP